jgi:transposase
MMRYELTDYEWAAIRPMLPNKARGVRRGTIDVSSTASAGCCDPGAPWRDLPDCYRPCTTCDNRFVRWRRAGVWGRIMISDKPMTEEEWARERATVIDDQTNNNEPARFGDGREEKHAAKRLEPKRK